MKIIAFVTAVIVCCQVSFAGDGQKVSLSLKDAPLEKAFNEIKRQSGYIFWYENNLLNDAARVTVSVKDVPLVEALDLCFKNQPLDYKIVGQTIVVTGKTKEASPPETITGRITDDNGKPLPNVTVRIRNESAATVSDEDGNFHIRTGGNATLIFSHVGYLTQEVRPGSRQVVNIVMVTAPNSLGQAVVVGYGTQSKRDITTSIASLHADEINNFPATGLDKAMKGKLAGVQVLEPNGAPGAGISIHVRGTGTITAGSDPLYVIDGVPLSDNDITGPGFKVNPLNAINVNDIESIDVLKDASAAAIYGSRGSNGVVIITTKRGKKDQQSVNYNSYYGVQQTSKMIPMLNATQYAQLIYDAHNNTYFGDLAALGLIGNATDANATRLSKLGAAPTNTSLPYLMPPEIFPYLNHQPGLTNTNWQKAIFQNAPIQSHTLSTSGGSDHVQYYISGNYLDQNGIVINSGYKRYSTRINLDAHYDHFRVGGSINYNYSIYNYLQTEGAFNNANQNIIEGALVASPFFPVHNSDGSYNYSQYAWQWSQSNGVNPVALAMLKHDKTFEKKLLGNLYADYELLKGLRYRISFGADITDFNRSTFYPSTLPSPLTLTTPSVPTASFIGNQITNWVVENTMNYVKRWGDHSIQAVAGFTLQKERDNASNIGATGFPNDIVQTLNAATTITSWTSAINEWSLLSGLARVQYAYKDRYLLSAAIRADGSSRFGPDNKYGYFPSASAGWVVSDEAFLKDSKVVSNWKVRASYGQTGNFQIGDYAYLATLTPANYVTGPSSGTLQAGLYENNPANPELGWEKTAAVDIGTDISLWQGMLSATIDVYNNNTNHLLLNVPVPNASGFGTNLVNIGKVNNRGIEVTLSNTSQLGKFRLTNTINYSSNHNKVISLGGVNSIITEAQNVIYFITQVGKPVGNYYTLVKTGVYRDQTDVDTTKAKVAGAQPGDFKFKDVNGDGVVNGNDKTITGNYQPKFMYGYSGQLQYGILDFGASLQGLYGNTIANIAQRHYNSSESYGNNTTDALGRWVSPEDPGNGRDARANRSETGLNATISTYHLSPGSYMRVRDLTLGITAPQRALHWAHVTSVRLYVTAENPFTVTKYNGYNPEVSIDPNPIQQGIDYGSYPVSKTYLVGLNVKF